MKPSGVSAPSFGRRALGAGARAPFRGDRRVQHLVFGRFPGRVDFRLERVVGGRVAGVDDAAGRPAVNTTLLADGVPEALKATQLRAVFGAGRPVRRRSTATGVVFLVAVAERRGRRGVGTTAGEAADPARQARGGRPAGTARAPSTPTEGCSAHHSELASPYWARNSVCSPPGSISPRITSESPGADCAPKAIADGLAACAAGAASSPSSAGGQRRSNVRRGDPSAFSLAVHCSLVLKPPTL